MAELQFATREGRKGWWPSCNLQMRAELNWSCKLQLPAELQFATDQKMIKTINK
ncbi:hypothetical protein [Pseudomonas putida]|uniref:Uncharacterized protein n=1 Tax=Pseudomonas putida TaxID=303 RepID=A0A8I1ECU5_PSEPU|nr:hypothetical protein [Pseudomonas putida]MBI6882934.1 hypothetical protein [Pseudomonas putida]